ncbi:MAG: hypothetical protein IT497_00040 [Ottowia sp.]|nr:hypothetical protein [Ottowia sp.]
MKSSKYEYQIVTMPGDMFGVRYRPNATYLWEYSKFTFPTVEQAAEFKVGLMEDDDFDHQVVEI